MPQATWLRPYIFLIHINDLQTTLRAFKFIYDVTVIEVIEVIDSIASSQNNADFSQRDCHVVYR